MKTNTNTNNVRMMRMRQLTEYLALSKAHIYQKISEGMFPKGHMLSPGIRAWQVSEVWISGLGRLEMENPNTRINVNAEAPDIDNETIAQTDESATTKVDNQPSQGSIELDSEALLLDMEANIQSSPDQFIGDGTIHRFDVNAVGDQKGWYAYHFTEDISYTVYGDWSEGETYRWHSLEDTVITAAQNQKLKSASSAAQKIRNEARALEQAQAAKKCKELWNAIKILLMTTLTSRKRG